MKKVISLLLTLTLMAFSAVCFTGCESRSERAAREAGERVEEAQKQAQKAREEYNDLKKRVDDYNNARDKLHSY